MCWPDRATHGIVRKMCSSGLSQTFRNLNDPFSLLSSLDSDMSDAKLTRGQPLSIGRVLFCRSESWNMIFRERTIMVRLLNWKLLVEKWEKGEGLGSSCSRQSCS